jgi:hypothetical protein
MKNDDFDKLMKELQAVDIQLPLHKKALRDHIIEVQARRSGAKPRSIIAIGARAVKFRRLPASRKFLSIGAVLLVVGILLAGLLIFLPMSHQAPAKKLIAEAAEKAGQMSPEKVAAISKDYKDLNDSLDDAKKSGDVRIAPASEVRQVLDSTVQEAQAAEVYVAYTDTNENTVVIGLGTENEPLFAVDVGKAERDLAKAEREAAKALAKEEKQLAKAARTLEKSARKGVIEALLD